jgi:hypothetical protein
MRRSFTFPIMVLVAVFLNVACLTGAFSSPSAISGDINLENQWPIAPLKGEETVLQVQGAFILTERSGLDLISPVTATVSVSSGQWDAVPRVSSYSDVTPNEWTKFIIDVTIPPEARSGENSPYTVTVRFEGQVSNDEVTAGFVVTIISVTGDDDTVDDDVDPSDTGNDQENKRFPYWPVFLLGLIAILVIAGIWAYRNVEIVRETDGRRRIYLREKDTGRIIGKDR